ncbi:MAG: class I SAM-dependent methyltransferase [Candidatus Brocadiae bacterium]|nr:class I SAM-dependent methyltransferase [Candidatus Brocadiia bacterium]
MHVKVHGLSAADLHPVPCSLCGSAVAACEHRRGLFQYCRCSRCRFVFLSPRPTQEKLVECYQRYLPSDTPDVDAWGRMMEVIFRRAADHADRHRGGRPGDLLDIGCAHGFFLDVMRARGWRVRGLEIARGAIAAARGKGHEVVEGTLDGRPFPDGSFDVVSAFYVVEHVYDPVAFLRSIHALLRPGGLAIIRWPHTAPLVRLLMTLREDLGLYDPPWHLSQFEPDTIARAMQIAGFRDVVTETGGWTLPASPIGRLISATGGRLAEAWGAVTGRLFPGVSKTTTGIRAAASR